MEREATLENYYPFVAYHRVKTKKTNRYPCNAVEDEEGKHNYYLIKFESFLGRASQFILSRCSPPLSKLAAAAGSDYGRDDHEEEEEEDDDDDDKGCGQYFSFRRYPSSLTWFLIQLSWRLILSVTLGVLVFYVATKPPPPIVSIKMASMERFELREGVDNHGVGTKLLNCNCSMEVVIENKSKIFGLHIHPPQLEMSFNRLPLAFARGEKSYAERGGVVMRLMKAGSKGKAMYGAGSSMRDKLNSRPGLVVVARLSLESKYRVVGDMISPKFHHKARCVLHIHMHPPHAIPNPPPNCKFIS